MKISITIIIAFFITTGLVKAQDTLYMYKSGVVMNKRAVVDMDSITFAYTPSPKGILKDIDGNDYHWITIGTQKWMVENLKTTKFRTGESISYVSDGNSWGNASFGAWCDYNNDGVNGAKYGHLYNWYAVNDSRKIAPEGWHIPSDIEWLTLESFLIKNGYNYDNSFSGNKIAKSLASTSDWTVSSSSSSIGNVGQNLSTNNGSGFTAFPAGIRYVFGNFYSLMSETAWWSSSENIAITNDAWYRIIYYDSSYFSRSETFSKGAGLSVRCIKD